MRAKREKVIVAMSGGVDSSVAACLLVERGYDVMGLFMRVGASESATDDVPRDSSSHSRRATDGSLPVGSDRNLSRKVTEPRASARAALRNPAIGIGSRELDKARSDGLPAAPGSATRLHRGCCGASDAADARFVAGILGIPFYALNFEEDFDWIIDYFAEEYARGRTPNPCVLCNDRLKFGKLVAYADAVGARYIATGHYARIGHRNRRPVLMRASDQRKDQSYVLFGLNRDMLDRVMFPVGDLNKREVRAIARRYGLPNRDKPDSVEICFVPDRDYARVVRNRRPEAFLEGKVVDAAGRVLGRHKGIAHYTIGQRRGLGIAAGRPIYVTQLDALTNTVMAGDGVELLRRSLLAERVNFLIDPPSQPFRGQVKIRYLHAAAPATIHPLGGRRARVVFDVRQRAITPGQAVVFYDGDLVLGGGWIAQVENGAD